jgi:hypothetical protein
LREAFTRGSGWPLDRASLAALVDIGLTDQQIAEYFSVGTHDVHQLKEQLGLDRGPR